MQSCPRCGRLNSITAAYCAGCGQPLAYPTFPAITPGAVDDPETAAAPSREAAAETTARAGASARRPSRMLLAVLGILALVGLAGATALKVVTQPGRVVPPPDPKVRAAPPPSSATDEDDEAGAPAPAAKPTATRKPATRAAAAPAKGAAKPAVPALGPPPSLQEIQTCINRRRGRLRTCANQAAQRMEFPGGGTARATLNPDGKFTNVRVPGGGYFASCAARVIRGTTCRAYKGEPIPVSYPLR